MSNVFDKSWEPAVSVTVTLSLTVSVALSVSVSLSVTVDPWDMLNNFCFHVYAQKSLFIGENDNVYFWTSAPAAPP